MKIISQRNPLWSQHKLGKSNLTIGLFGCTTCCICMVADYFGEYHDPVAMQGYQGYTPEGLIIWESLKLKKMKFGKRLRKFDPAEIQVSLKDPKKAVILEVENRHWVVALNKLPFVNVYRIADPWTGTIRLSTAYKYISGSAHFYSL